MLVVSLVTLGSPEQLTGGYLYHRRMAEAAAGHDARVDFVSARWGRNPLQAAQGDVILVDSIAAALVAPWLWGRRCRRPLCAILHQPPGGIDHRSLRRVGQRLLDRSFYRRCPLLMVASDALRDELVNRHGMPAAAMHVVAPGRDVAAASGEPVDLRAGRRAAFLSVGNWVARKGTLELLEAFARLPPDLATLHLAGRDDADAPYAARVRARLAQPDLARRVVVHGPVARQEVARLYRDSDAFVLPSYREPYGTVYGEALAAGLPVVGWRAGNLPNLATDGKEGVVLEPGDVSGLSASLHRLAVDEPWREQLAEAARRRGERLPTWAETAAEFFGLLKRSVPHDG